MSPQDLRVEVSSLSTAELRLVPWMSTHLSFREIGLLGA
jgi:hypothetical protein